MRARLLLAVFVVMLARNGSAQEHAPTAPECIGANERAITLRKDHHLQSAREESVACAAPTCPWEIREECSRRVSLITNALPTIVFDVKDERGNDAAVVDLKVDGELSTARIDGTAIALDPGTHTFWFSSPQTEPVTRQFVLREGEKNRHEVVVLVEKKATSAASYEKPSESRARSPIARGAGFGLVGLGLVGVGFGAFFGLRAASAWSRSKEECSVDRVCTQSSHDQAVQDRDDAVQNATISTIAFSAGGALIAGGAVLIFVAPGVTPKSASVTLAARF